MLRSSLIKFTAIAVFAIIPFSAQAKTVTFGGDKWDVNENFAMEAESPVIRNDNSLIEIMRNALLGSSLRSSGKLLKEETRLQLSEIEQKVNRKAENAQLVIESDKAEKFNPGQNGRVVDLPKLVNLLQGSQPVIEVPVLFNFPAIKLSDTNQLGIEGLVAEGVSNFKGSSRSRITNITVGASRYNGLIIQPGEEFSFNEHLGDIDAAHGFLPELVIKPEGVLPEFGGGLCQVSTTVFRAAMNSGLPITARRNHSFAVAYYAPQGTDATIYPGSSDLRFINDYKTPILIRTRIEDTKLYFEYYGKKDGREVAFEGPIQYDKKSDGSMKASWTRKINKNGQTETKVFQSIYRSPALYHPVAQPATPNPQSQ